MSWIVFAVVCVLFIVAMRVLFIGWVKEINALPKEDKKHAYLLHGRIYAVECFFCDRLSWLYIFPARFIFALIFFLKEKLRNRKKKLKNNKKPAPATTDPADFDEAYSRYLESRKKRGLPEVEELDSANENLLHAIFVEDPRYCKLLGAQWKETLAKWFGMEKSCSEICSAEVSLDTGTGPFAQGSVYEENCGWLNHWKAEAARANVLRQQEEGASGSGSVEFVAPGAEILDVVEDLTPSMETIRNGQGPTGVGTNDADDGHDQATRRMVNRFVKSIEEQDGAAPKKKEGDNVKLPVFPIIQKVLDLKRRISRNSPGGAEAHDVLLTAAMYEEAANAMERAHQKDKANLVLQKQVLEDRVALIPELEKMDNALITYVVEKDDKLRAIGFHLDPSMEVSNPSGRRQSLPQGELPKGLPQAAVLALAGNGEKEQTN